MTCNSCTYNGGKYCSRINDKPPISEYRYTIIHPSQCSNHLTWIYMDDVEYCDLRDKRTLDKWF